MFRSIVILSSNFELALRILAAYFIVSKKETNFFFSVKQKGATQVHTYESTNLPYENIIIQQFIIPNSILRYLHIWIEIHRCIYIFRNVRFLIFWRIPFIQHSIEWSNRDWRSTKKKQQHVHQAHGLYKPKQRWMNSRECRHTNKKNKPNLYVDVYPCVFWCSLFTQLWEPFRRLPFLSFVSFLTIYLSIKIPRYHSIQIKTFFIGWKMEKATENIDYYR